jgi:hypothetical protein
LTREEPSDFWSAPKRESATERRAWSAKGLALKAGGAESERWKAKLMKFSIVQVASPTAARAIIVASIGLGVWRRRPDGLSKVGKARQGTRSMKTKSGADQDAFFRWADSKP